MFSFPKEMAVTKTAAVALNRLLMLTAVEKDELPLTLKRQLFADAYDLAIKNFSARS